MNDNPPYNFLTRKPATAEDIASIPFYYLIGVCIARWAFIDRELFRICRFALELDENHLTFFYYRLRGFNQRLKFTDDAIKVLTKTDPSDTRWKDLLKRIDTLSQTRNIIAHQPPIKRQSKDENGEYIEHYIFAIYIEPHSLPIDGDHRGLQGKEELRFDDLRAHDSAALALEKDLRAFRESLTREKPSA